MLDLESKKAKSIVDYKRARIFMVKYNRRDKIIKSHIKSFSGYATLMWVKVKENQMIDVDFKVLEGECALTYVQKKSVHVISQKDFLGPLKLEVKKGMVRFRVIGEKANVDLLINL